MANTLCGKIISNTDIINFKAITSEMLISLQCGFHRKLHNFHYQLFYFYFILPFKAMTPFTKSKRFTEISIANKMSHLRKEYYIMQM